MKIGDRLGSYEILAPIGKGGMGEVWKARDTGLGRDVALKILPAAFASDPDRMARFEREARVLASLDHPNIAAIYGLEESDGIRALVLALIDGPTLADRIAAGPIPLDEAIQIARQIAEAVEYAHERGVIHRDLKPANIKITSGGMVKVLDFGLAKALDDEPVAASSTNSPTLTMNATRAGVLLGTAAYMSPEQAKGKQADRRSDIWSFGAVVYEMVTGKPPFSGESVGEVIAAVIKDEPKLDGVPAALRELIARCLNKDPRQRLQAIGEARIALERPLPPSGIKPAVAERVRQLRWMIAAGVFAVVLLAVALIHFRQARPAAPRIHFSIPLPENSNPFFALSPDNRMLVMSVPGSGLSVRALDSNEIRPLSDTFGRTPFWSPDSRTIAFFAGRKLQSMPASGGPAQTLCDETGAGAGGTWSRNGVIVFATDAGVLYRVPAVGGRCAQLIKNETGVLRRFPVFLPDGQHFLYSLRTSDEARRGLYLASLSDPNGQRLLPDQSSAVFAPDTSESNRGYLLFSREQKLTAQAFDAGALQLIGDPLVLADQVSFTLTPPQVAASVSENGIVAYLSNGRPDRQLVWYDRSGKELGRAARTGFNGGGVSLAPEGKKVAFYRADAQNTGALWLQDFDRNSQTRLIAPPLDALSAAVWSADGQRFVFYASGAGVNAIYLKNTNGGREEILLRGGNPLFPSSWSQDGRWLLYTDNDPRTGADLWLLPEPSKPSADHKPYPLLRTPSNESQGQISPDGKWLAYVSNESGAIPGDFQVFLRRFAGSSPLPDSRWQISTDRGIEPRWSADGKELFYLEAPFGTARRYKLMSVPIGSGAVNPAGSPKQLFEFRSSHFAPQLNRFLYSPAHDGQRFLIDVYATETQPTLDVLLNWQVGLTK